MAIQDIIKKRRLSLNLTLKDVADALDVAESTVSRYETSNISNMGIDKLKALADVLQCTPAYLMGWEDDEPEPEPNRETKQLLNDFSKLTRDQQLTVLALIHSMNSKEK